MKVFVFVIFGLLVLSTTTIAHAMQIENPLVPYMDSGEGYGESPSTNQSERNKYIEEKKSNIIRSIFENLLKEKENNLVIPTPTVQLPIPTQSLPSLTQIVTPTANPNTSITPAISPNSNDKVPPNTTQIEGCPPGNTKIHYDGTIYKHLNQQFPCFAPRMFVVHWSAAWSSAQATFDVLNDRERSCQFAIDDKTTLQMLDFYENAVQQGWCVGGDNNIGSISYEITGVYFDDVLNSPQSANYARLMKMTDTTVQLTCRLINKYGISKSAIYGHYELQTGKQDPGPAYLEFFKQKVEEAC